MLKRNRCHSHYQFSQHNHKTMPNFLEKKLKSEYPKEPAVPYKIMNSIGAMRGSKDTPKGAAMENKHDTKVEKPKIGMTGRMNKIIVGK